MSWTAHLAARRAAIFQKGPSTVPTKLTELRSVSFDGNPDDRFKNIVDLSIDDLRFHLPRLADDEQIDPIIVHLFSIADLDACAGQTEDFLRAYLRALHDSDLRERGQVPRDETAAIRCVRCGPVFAAPEVERVLPIVRGMPTAAGCPWCHNRSAGLPIPRPPRAGIR